jgi:predicted ATPase/DNA-binding winged helix-turn-helix (wHTH) protein
MDLIRIGSYEVYPGERLLKADGKPVELGARAFDLLLVLAENPGRLVTKAALIERVWPRLVVDENNLPAQIAGLRRILGPGAIRTVPRFGYRLDLPVSRTDTDGRGAVPPAIAGPGRPGIGQRGVVERTPTLVGREAELGAVQDVLARERLLTLVGAAGVGKSRLAREVLARELERPGGAAAFVSLEALDGIERVPSAISVALDLSIAEAGDRFLALGLALEGLGVLLVLDGAEHLAAELAEPLATLAERARGLRVLVTSQTPLGRPGESLYRLGPLPVAEAVSLFMLRAGQADPRFAIAPSSAPLVEEICRRLDGNPLAVELAAARVPTFGLSALLAHLDDRLRLLKLSGRPGGERHGVLQAAFDWSYGLLAPAEQRVFDRLGAFAGSFALDAAARAVADESLDMAGAVDLVGRLVDRSLVTMLPREPARYRLLETARFYARTRLDSTRARQDSERRMAGALLHLLDRAYEDYWSADEAVWLHQHEPELDNVRAALEWARRNDAGVAISLYGSAWPLFVETDLHAEARAAHAEAVGLLNDAMPPARTARFWEAVSTYDSERQFDRARYAAEIAAAIHARAGDLRAQYYALMQLALNWRDDPDAANRTLAAARRLEQPTWPSRLLAHGATVEGGVMASAGRHADARSAYRRALDHALVASERQALAATVQVVELDIASGEVAKALQLARPLAISLRHSGRRETRHELLSLLFGALLLAGEHEEARTAGIELYELAKRLDLGRRYQSLDAMALLAAIRGRHELAARIAVAAESAHESRGQARRRPAAARLRGEVEALVDAALGAGWRTRAIDGMAMLDEEEACERALGLCTQD